MGNISVLADPHRCVSCKSCMAACAAKHSAPSEVAAPRLRVVQLNRQSTAPVVCHHCEDAPCVAACPANALFHDTANRRVGVDARYCIACRSCVAACPFGAIDLAYREAPESVAVLLGDALCRASLVKCDRCVDREEGPACVQACSFGALHLVERDENGVVQTVFDKGCAPLAFERGLVSAGRGEK